MTLKTVLLLLTGSFVVTIAAAPAQDITDPQIAAIVVAANQVDIDAGNLAAASGSSAEVKAFGKQMVTDHTGVNKQATELVTKLKVTPEEKRHEQESQSRRRRKPEASSLAARSSVRQGVR